jgi:hypothetical protein
MKHKSTRRRIGWEDEDDDRCIEYIKLQLTHHPHPSTVRKVSFRC